MKTKGMKNNRRRVNRNRGYALLTMLALVCALAVGGTFALTGGNRTAIAEATQTEVAEPTEDTSPAIYVAQKNANSVVGIITSTEGWSRSTGVMNTPVSQGSGVVIAEGGYVLTNNHVIEDGSAFQVLMPNGDKVDASLVGADSAMDLAVLKVEDAEQAAKLTPVTVGASANLPVGSTVIAIGNPGGEILANTVTRGIISALERSSVSSNNTTRNVNYIQHDAPISSGNSGGGLFDYKGNLIGINTLKYGGSFYSSGSYEGLGFAIPIETAYPIAQQLMENGKVVRPQIGVTVTDQEGPDDPMNEYAPASVCVMSVSEGSGAEKAGLQQYDFITAVNGQRVKTSRELTTILDTFKPGDTVTLTIVRYNNVGMQQQNNGYDSYYSNPFGYGFGFPFGGYGYGYGYGDNGYGNGNGGNGGNGGYYGNGTLTVGGGFSTFDVQVTLEEKQ